MIKNIDASKSQEEGLHSREQEKNLKALALFWRVPPNSIAKDVYKVLDDYIVGRVLADAINTVKTYLGSYEDLGGGL